MMLKNIVRTLVKKPNIKYQFCFFNQNISTKYGKKCCRYNQDGKPMPINKVNEAYQSLSQFLRGWKITDEGHKLTKHYYTEDYPKTLQFLYEVIKIDKNQFKQCPKFTVENGEIVRLQLYSITLKGLSMTDFQLAMRINNIDHSKFMLIELKDPENYRKQVSKVRMQRQSKRIQQMLDQDTKQWKSNP